MNAHVCDICGGSPCASRMFCRVCREADRKQHQRQHNLPDKWQTLPVGAVWERLNDPHRRPDAPRSTYDALLYELRTYGLAQLAKPNCRDRLSNLSKNQLRELIAALMRLKPHYPAIDDELLLGLGGQL